MEDVLKTASLAEAVQSPIFRVFEPYGGSIVQFISKAFLAATSSLPIALALASSTAAQTIVPTSVPLQASEFLQAPVLADLNAADSIVEVRVGFWGLRWQGARREFTRRF